MSNYEGHTLGPWIAAERGDYSDFDGNSRIVLGEDGNKRIIVIQHDGDAEAEANTALVLAAPTLAADNAELQEVVGELVDRLKAASDQFRYYERLHREKSPPALDKSKANREMAEYCEAALTRARPFLKDTDNGDGSG